MKATLKKHFLLTALLAYSLAFYAQSTMGKDFWVAFLPTFSGCYPNLAHARQDYYYLLAAGPRGCSGTVNNPQTGWNARFEVSPGHECVIPIPFSEAFPEENMVNKTGLHVNASDTISLTAFVTNFELYGQSDQKPYLADLEAFLVFPTNKLRDEYMITTSPANSWDQALFSVLAVEDNTLVRIVTTCDASHSGPHANTPFYVSLNAGECYHLRTVSSFATNITMDFTGTYVKAQGGKRIAVVAGNSGRREAQLIEQMIPVCRWGKTFLIVPSKLYGNDSVQVTALHDKCEVFRNGVKEATLRARESYVYRLPDGVKAELLETTQPASVNQYPVHHWPNIYETQRYYKKAMVAIHPLEQGVSTTVFTNAIDSIAHSEYPEFYLTYYANISTETANVSSMRLDGRNIASSFQPLPHDGRYSYARVTLQPGTHTLSNSKGVFTAQVYGGRPGNDPNEVTGYAYSAGSMMRDFSSQILINGKYTTDYPQGLFFCEDDTPVFSLRTDFAVSRAEWDFGDGDTATGATVPHHFPGPGDYLVSCDVYTHGNGSDSLAASLHASVHIQRPVENDVWWTVCDGCYWNGMHCTASGDYTANLQTVGGCDSIVHLHLSLHHSDTAFYDVTACDSYLWRDSLYTRTGRYLHDEGSTALGCDSVAVLRLKIRHDPPFAVQGIEQVAYATDIWPGVYRYLAVDSTLLEGGAVSWECSNPDWVVTPLSDFSCQVFVRTPGQATLTATTNGCHSTASILLNATPFGVGEDHGDGVEVRPNPAKDEVVVTGKGIQQVEIHNLLGQRVVSVEGHAAKSLTVSLEGLAEGVYLVSVQLGDGKRHEKKLVVR